jgi:plasmid stabilization system protein ParE
MASLPISGTAFGQIIARAILKRARSKDEADTLLAVTEILINECTGIKHQEEGAVAAEAFEREALTALAETLAQPRKSGRSQQ